MTIQQAIDCIDERKPNGFSAAEKIAWLTRADGMIKAKILDGYRQQTPIAFVGYTEDTDPETQLLVPEPYCEVYPLWLEAQMDAVNSETARYNNAIVKYNDWLSAFRNDYNRTHTPVKNRIKFF